MLLNSWSLATGHSMDFPLYDEAGYRLHPLLGMGWIITLLTLELKTDSPWLLQLCKASRSFWHQWEGVEMGGSGIWPRRESSVSRIHVFNTCSPFGRDSCIVPLPAALSHFSAVLGLHCWVGFSFIAESRGYPLLRCMGLSLLWLPLWSTGTTCMDFSIEALGLWSAGWVVVVHGLRCSVISGIYPDQRSYWCPLHCKVDS